MWQITDAHLESLAAVRKVWPERLPLTVRLGIIDYVEGEQPFEETVELAKRRFGYRYLSACRPQNLL